MRSPVLADRSQVGPGDLGIVILAMAAMLAGSSCTNPSRPPPAEFQVDTSIRPTSASITGLDHGAPRAVGAIIGPNGEQVEFVANELILRPASQDELQNFITTYNATVLRDGTPLIIPGNDRLRTPESSGSYLLRIDPSKSALDDLAQNMTSAGFSGQYRISSDDSARTLAVFVREFNRNIALNRLLYLAGSLEHPDYGGGNLDASTWPYMTDDDQGLSVGVFRAWEFLGYNGILEKPGLYYIPRIAIVDTGFNLDETTGAPLDGNLDYSNSPDPPMQGDIIDRDFSAGGPYTGDCPGGGTACSWHGQESFGVAAAYPKNAYGSAGMAGHFVKPMVYRIAVDLFSGSDAIHSAVINGADVISCSWFAGCISHTLCSIPPADRYDALERAVKLARSYGVIVLAAAGNAGMDVNDVDQYPCKMDGVICVGAVIQDGTNLKGDGSPLFNYGDRVDISGISGVFSTVTPDSAARDPDNIGVDELTFFEGTSCSTPFVAGIVGLMKSANADLSYEQVLSILQSTANPSVDARVPRGYVDAYRAVRGLLPNQAPTVRITYPPDGTAFGWNNQILFTCDYRDPEVDPNDTTAIYRFHGTVVYSAEVDGELCRSDSPPYTCTSTKPLSVGAQIITATATDPFDATNIFQIKLNILSRPPEPHITAPLSTDPLYSHIPVHFAGFVVDPDESIDAANMTWSSSIDGALGTGLSFDHVLSAGTHVITLTAVDGKGLTASDSVTVTVVPGAGLPTPTITNPADNAFFSPGDTVALQGSATDPEDGQIPPGRLTWYVDGVFVGTGHNVSVTLTGPTCTSVIHTITLKARDSDGHEVSIHIGVFVGTIC